MPLSDEETRVIFTEEAASNLAELDGSDRETVLERLIDIVTSDAPPSAFVHEQIGTLDILTVGSQGRLYAKIVDELPRGNTEYHVVFLLYLDMTHEYPQSKLAEYSAEADRRLSWATALETVEDVERFLCDRDALDEADLRALL